MTRPASMIPFVFAVGLLVCIPSHAAPGPAGKPKRAAVAQAEDFKTQVPAHDIDVILGRPTSDSITLSVLAYRDMDGFVSYGTTPDHRPGSVEKLRFVKDRPIEIALKNLKADAQYYYRCGEVSADGPKNSAAFIEGSFHTQRATGKSFVFTVTADSHLDQRTEPQFYKRTLSNAAADKPDFHIDLGDTFMTEKHPTREDAFPQYLAQRYYFGLLSSSSPLFLVVGNHDGESSRELDGTAGSLGVWANTMRKRYFPNPIPDGFYSGDVTPAQFAGQLQDYYAWQWGDAQFIVLDPYWFSAKSRGRDDNWSCSLGQVQYQWLKRTLEGSKSKYKFVFIHQLVGGFTNNGRGGAEAAPFFEWGGENADGIDGFAARRPGWPEPVHELLVKNHVSVVFHGHDHLFAKQDLDGIVYQEVPQPGSDMNLRNGRSAEYGYTHGTILGGGGYMRVSVSADSAKVEYIQTNGGVAFSYTVSAKEAKAAQQ
jgi:predicted phosphodiesterase